MRGGWTYAQSPDNRFSGHPVARSVAGLGRVGTQLADMDQRQETSTKDSDLPRVSLVCDRCGFSFRAGLIWVIQRRKIYFCRDCQKEIDLATAELSQSQRVQSVEAMVRKLGLNTRGDQDSRLDALMTAALLGFHERLSKPEDFLPGNASLRESKHLY